MRVNYLVSAVISVIELHIRKRNFSLPIGIILQSSIIITRLVFMESFCHESHMRALSSIRENMHGNEQGSHLTT